MQGQEWDRVMLEMVCAGRGEGERRRQKAERRREKAHEGTKARKHEVRRFLRSCGLTRLTVSKGTKNKKRFFIRINVYM